MTNESLEKNRKRSRDWYWNNKKRVQENFAKWYANNKKKVKERAKVWVLNNRDRYEANQSRWRLRVSAKRVSQARQRRIDSLAAQPSWANEFFMSEAYRLAEMRSRMLGFKWQVDHIVPLRSKLVCGLHVHNNLRVIPAISNNQKGNRYWPDMP